MLRFSVWDLVDAYTDVCTDSEFERLSRDNMTTINSYGTNLMDIICRDACDGHDVGRVKSALYIIVWTN